MIIPLLDGVDLDILPAKDNQPGVFDALDALPWRGVPVACAATDRGYGRIETRTIEVMDAPGDLPFRALHLAGRHDTTEATRNMGRPFAIPGLASRSLLRPRSTARKGQGSYQEDGQHQSDAR